MRTNTKLRDMNIAVSATNERAIEVLASGHPMRRGAQLAVDITMRSALTADGVATLRGAHTDGVALARLMHSCRGPGDRRTMEHRGRRLHLPVDGKQGA